MQQLNGLDNFFLMSERGNSYNHVAALGIYDPSTSPNGKVRFKEILKHFESRLHTRSLFRRRLVTVPFGLDRPYWVDDPAIDVEFHIRHIALPEPGDWRQLMIQIARLHSRPLDRSRPLWEIYVIEGLDRIPGLPGKAFALFCKFHHSQLDGNAAIQLLREIHAESAEPDEEAGTPAPVYADRAPLNVELYSRAVGNSLHRSAGIARFLGKTARLAGSLAAKALAHARGNASALDTDGLKAALGYGKAPYTRFNQKVSANRSVEAIGLPLSDIKRIRQAIPGATINDIFLTVASGAVRNYLLAKGELPDASLRALMPISIRVGHASKGGNEVGGVPVMLHTDMADPVACLHAVAREAALAKRGAEIIGPDFVKSVNNDLPFPLANLFMQRMVLDQLNCAVSNVRGPDQPLYVAGARAVQFYPVSIPVDNVGLNFTGVSYDGVLWVSMVACRNIVPDPAFLAQCLRSAFADLLTTAEAQVPPVATPIRKAKPGRTRTAPQKKAA